MTPDTTTSTERIYKRIRRRETTSPRATLAIILAIVLILAIAYAVTETILALVGAAPLIAAPPAMGTAILGLTSYSAAPVVIGGVVAVLVGLLLIIAAVRPGRRPRHPLASERVLTVVDDEVIASALARTAALEGGVDPDHARVSMSRRSALVRVTPASGASTPTSAITAAVSWQLDGLGLTPTPRAKTVLDRARVGA